MAVVTGAGKGIGRQTAVILGAAGATVVLADLDKDGLEETASRIERAVVVPTDVSIRADVDTLALEAIRVGGRIDVWANVAGIIRTAHILELDERTSTPSSRSTSKAWCGAVPRAARVMSQSQAGLDHQRGVVRRRDPGPFARGLRNDKGGRDPVDQDRRRRVGPSGVRVECRGSRPGRNPNDGAALDRAGRDMDEELRLKTLGRLGRSPLGIIGTPQDIAWAILYLASDISRFTTGQVMRVNGGIHMA